MILTAPWLSTWTCEVFINLLLYKQTSCNMQHWLRMKCNVFSNLVVSFVDSDYVLIANRYCLNVTWKLAQFTFSITQFMFHEIYQQVNYVSYIKFFLDWKVLRLISTGLNSSFFVYSRKHLRKWFSFEKQKVQRHLMFCLCLIFHSLNSFENCSQ